MGGSKGLCGVVLKSDIGDGRVRLNVGIIPIMVNVYKRY